MTKSEKNSVIDGLVQELGANPNFYLADISSLNAAATHELRKACHEKSVTMRVVKNTLLYKAIERTGNSEMTQLGVALKGNTAIMFAEGASIPARLIKDFRKKSDRPLLKGAWVGEGVFIGDESLDALIAIKSKEEVIGEIIGLLQSPAQNVISALQSPGRNLAGILKTLAEKEG